MLYVISPADEKTQALASLQFFAIQFCFTIDAMKKKNGLI